MVLVKTDISRKCSEGWVDNNMSVKFGLKILHPERMNKDILIALNNHIRLALKNTSATDIQKWGGERLYNKMMWSDTAWAIGTSGELKGELGITDTAALWNILKAISENSSFKIRGPRITGKQISMSMRYEAVPVDLTQYESIGVQITEKGQSLPWFQWLTTLGDAVIVRDFEVQAGFPQWSRTGDKIMVKGKGWRVPPSHSGSPGNNFITKAADEALQEIGNEWVQQIRRVL